MNEPVMTKTPRMIGREEIVRDIKKALQSNVTASSQVIYIHGVAGIGKTRLLNEVKNMLSPTESRGFNYAWSGIIDLYNDNMQNPAEVEFVIANACDPENEFFTTYWETYEQIAKTKGLSGKFTESREQLTQAFRHDLKKLAKTKKVVLTFDTVELLQNERDDVQKTFKIKSLSTSLIRWLTTTLKETNTVTILAGRYDNYLKQQLEAYFGESFTDREIKPFSPNEANNFLDSLTENRSNLHKKLTLDIRQKMYSRTGGKPIYLSLLVDLLSLGAANTEISEFLPPDEADADEEPPHEAFEKTIVEWLSHLTQAYDDHAFALTRLAYCRQGLDVDLLVYLTQGQWPPTRAEKILHDLSKYTFVKSPVSEEKLLFFHDELYDLFDRHYLNDRAAATNIFELLRDYYKHQYDRLDRQLQGLQDTFFTDASQLDQERYRLIKKREDAVVKRLFYALQVNPTKGYYDIYVKWDLEAIRANNIEFDMHLRSALLRFLALYILPGSPAHNEWLESHFDLQTFKQEAAARWVRRLISLGELVEAEKLAGKLRNEKKHPDFAWDTIDNALYKANVLTALSEALYYSPRGGEVLEYLHEAEELLESDTLQLDSDRKEKRFRDWLLGLTKNNLGFQFRAKHQLTVALSYYQEALRLYRSIDVKPEMATTTNNLAYVHGLLGGFDRALVLVDDALNLRRQAAQLHAEAISLNTKALILTAKGDLPGARVLCRRASQIFKDTNLTNSRGYYLLQIAQGRIARLSAMRVFENILPPDEANTLLGQAEMHLTEAEDNLQPDTIDAFEASLELGHTYRDLMQYYQSFTSNTQGIRRTKRAAMQCYNSAYGCAESLGLTHGMASVKQNCAMLHIADRSVPQAKSLDAAQAALEEAEALIPPPYKPKSDGKGFSNLESPINQIYRVFGQIYLTKAQIKIEVSSEEVKENIDWLSDMVETHLLAVACFEKASPNYAQHLPEVNEAHASLYAILKKRGRGKLEELQKHVEWMQESYNLSFTLTTRFLSDTLGVFSIKYL